MKLRRILLVTLIVLVAVTGAVVSAVGLPVVDPVPAYLSVEYHQLRNHLTDAGYWINDEHHGKYYNIEADGSRRTLGQPTRYDLTVWIFGNSGTLDPYVEDEKTMTTQLQALVLRAGYHWRVVNRGAGGQKAIGSLAWFKASPVRAGDIVIFIDGRMEDKTPDGAAEYTRTVQKARGYAQHLGATFYRFVQPSDGEQYIVLMVGPHLSVPPSGFVESVHMNALGDKITAAELYSAIAAF